MGQINGVGILSLSKRSIEESIKNQNGDSSIFKGDWDASTNTPTLTNGTGTAGDFYRVSFAGSVDFGAGLISFAVDDNVAYNGLNWIKRDFSLVASEIITDGTFTQSSLEPASNQSVKENLQRLAGARQKTILPSDNLEKGSYQIGSGNTPGTVVIQDLPSFQGGLGNEARGGKAKILSRETATAKPFSELRDVLAHYTTAERDAVLTWQANSIIWNETTNQIEIYNGTSWVDYKTYLNLNNVDNTSDANKPISTATQTALNGKFSKTTAGEIAGLTEKISIADADSIVINDSVAGNAVKKSLLSTIFTYITSKLTGSVSSVLTNNLSVNSWVQTNASGKFNNATPDQTTRLNSLLSTTQNVGYFLQTDTNQITKFRHKRRIGYFLVPGGSVMTSTQSISGYTTERILWGWSIEENGLAIRGSFGEITLTNAGLYEIEFNVTLLWSSSSYLWRLYNINTGVGILSGNHTYVSGPNGQRGYQAKCTIRTTSANERISVENTGNWGSSTYNPIANTSPWVEPHVMNYLKVYQLLD